ncbi:MAG: hypothetical protein QXS66_06985 [Thermoproteota archaeon]|nr:hypothetical protein [Candidatus Brockarchaeota archaeon]
MEWKLRIHRKALKFLEEISEEERKRVEEKLNDLLKTLESGTLLHMHLDVKKLKGAWEGFFTGLQDFLNRIHMSLVEGLNLFFKILPPFKGFHPILVNQVL